MKIEKKEAGMYFPKCSINRNEFKKIENFVLILKSI